MKNEVLKNWLRLGVVFVCVCVALVLLIAEPNKPYSGLAWLGVLVATKIGAIACGFVACLEVDKLTSEIKK